MSKHAVLYPDCRLTVEISIHNLFSLSLPLTLKHVCDVRYVQIINSTFYLLLRTNIIRGMEKHAITI